MTVDELLMGDAPVPAEEARVVNLVESSMRSDSRCDCTCIVAAIPICRFGSSPGTNKATGSVIEELAEGRLVIRILYFRFQHTVSGCAHSFVFHEIVVPTS